MKLKLRMWDRDYKTMHQFGENTHDTLCSFEDGNLFYYNLQNGEGSSLDGSDDDSTYVLMQHTGLKDKNGVEIYEGDIIRWHINREGTKTGFICECRGGFGLKWLTINGEMIERSITPLANFYPVDPDEVEGCKTEVIGNIHQHPHLLESGVQ